MDFNFTDEQTQLADGLKKFISKECGFEERKKIIHSPTGESEKIWKGFVDLGLLALPVPEEFGGLSGTPLDMLVVMQEFGRGLVVGPYYSTVWGAQILASAGSTEQKTELLALVAEGTCRLAVAFSENESRYDLAHVETKAVAKGNDYILTGKKSFVLGGGSADTFIVSARVSGGIRDKQGLALFLVDANAKGVSQTSNRTIDGYRASEVSLDQVIVSSTMLLGGALDAWEAIEEAADYATMLLCAQAVGAMEAMCHQTSEYTKTRKQFGLPIAKFQVLQHRMVDMFIHLEQARSMAYLAAVKISSKDAQERKRSISAAKVRIGQAGKFIAQQSIQTHGGMGMSDELAVSHYFKRLTIIELMLGDTDYHLQRFMDHNPCQLD